MNDTETFAKSRWEWMPRTVRALLSIPSVFYDGLCVFAIATLTTLATAFTSDDAYKYVNPYVIFWMKCGLGSIASGLVALQSFRNTAFARHLAAKQNGQQQTKQTP